MNITMQNTSSSRDEDMPLVSISFVKYKHRWYIRIVRFYAFKFHVFLCLE